MPTSVAPSPADIFQRAAKEGERRLDQSMIELLATGFIAGFSIVFGIVALGIIEALLGEAPEGLSKIAGALGLGIGTVFLVVGRAELFSENFFDPVAAVVQRWKPSMLLSLFRLWGVTFLLNLVGGGLFAWILSVDGALPERSAEVLSRIAEEIATRGALVGFVHALAGGALVALLSFLLQAVNSVGSRMVLAFIVGFLLAVGIFDHVVVTSLHLFFGILLGAQNVGFADVGWTLLIITAGNLVGGLGLVTLTHIAQAKG